ncbi:MAG: glutamate 5-kinase [Armatimonadota bacterium]|nr:glutamate 5-kinase [Armatimonadota bacterium]
MDKKAKRVIIKVGTSTLTNNSGKIDRPYLTSLASQIANLRSQSIDVVLVTSGAIRAGMERMGLPERPMTMPEKQAAAAVGQGLLMQMYSEIFEWHGLTTGQILLTREDFGDRRRYLNARNTMLSLLHHGVIPIVNENDTVAVDEIRVGDNDNLAALVASSLGADLLILLSDVPGLCKTDPAKSAPSEVIPLVTKIDDNIWAIAGKARSGTGGMRTKIEAAKIATKSGVTMIIADGRLPNVIVDIVSGKQIGTKFVPQRSSLSGRKRWIAFGAHVRGEIIINEGAKRMILEGGKSLLAAGITGVQGSFSTGDLVRIVDEEGNQIARGFVNYSASEIEKIKGRQSSEIEDILGYKDFDEVIHRDNMALGV